MWRVIASSFVLRIVLCGVQLAIGNRWEKEILAYCLIQYITTTPIFSQFNAILADIVDSDMIKSQREYPISSTVASTNALITKPAISIAPMLVVGILSNYGYDFWIDAKEEAKETGENTLDERVLENLNSATFYTICVFPLVLAVVQLVVWCFYPLKNTHVSTIWQDERSRKLEEKEEEI